MTKLKEFTSEELCEVGDGMVLHIRGGDKTLCGKGAIIDIAGLISVREDYHGLCKRCLAIYHKQKAINNGDGD